MPSRKRIAAIVLAAGYSSRAKAFKPLLPLGNATIISNAVNNFRLGGIDDITVVVGHRAEELTPVLDDLRVRHVYNKLHSQGMFSSVVAGLNALQPGVDAFFLLPADMPLVKSHTVKLMCRARKKKAADVIYPVFRGQRGHPPLISADLIPEVLSWNSPKGLRPLFRQHEANAYELEVLDEGILLDVDTPEDYGKITDYYRQRHIPTDNECSAILAKMAVPNLVVRHSRMVAAVAQRLAVSLNKAGLELDAGLVGAAGLLHDLAKGKPDHAGYGAKVLKKAGYPQVAKIVAVHTDIAFSEEADPDEAALVYLADKLVKGDRLVGLEERFQYSLEKFAADAGVLPMIADRLSKARAIASKVEKLLGMELGKVIYCDIRESGEVDE